MSEQGSALDPKRTALLVMDFQQGVLQRMPGLEPRGSVDGHPRLAGPAARRHRGAQDPGRRHLSDGTDDPGQQVRDVLLGRIFPRRAQVIDTATLRGLLSP